MSDNQFASAIRDTVQGVEEDFYYDDFFTSDSTPGTEIVVEIRGRKVPLTLKRGISFKDAAESQQNASKMRITPEGKPEMYDYNDFVYGVEMLARCIKSWPFVDRVTRQPIPITRERIAEFGSDGVQAVLKAINAVTAQKKAATAPFVKDSADHSSTTET